MDVSDGDRMAVRDGVSDKDVLHAEIQELRQMTEELRRRLAALESGLEQERRLHRRIAELTDLVQEVLLPAPRRNDKRIATLLRDYQSAL